MQYFVIGVRKDVGWDLELLSSALEFERCVLKWIESSALSPPACALIPYYTPMNIKFTSKRVENNGRL